MSDYGARDPIVALLEGVVARLGRIADADERRNELLEADRAERRAAWEQEVELRRAALRQLAQEQLAKLGADDDA